MQQDTPQNAGQKQGPQMAAATAPVSRENGGGGDSDILAYSRMNLTKEEMFALQSCSRESFYYRCVPLGVLLMGGTSILVNRGIIKGHPRFGAIPKNMFAGLVAYIAGKLSYQGECRKKIMALDNSPLAESMKRGRRGRDLITDMSALPGLSGGYQAEEAPPEPEAPKLSDSYSESNTQGQGLDDSKQPNMDGAPMPLSRADPEAPKFTSYEDLRQQNRLEYEQKQNPSLGSRQQAPVKSSPPSRTPPSSEYQKPVRRNQYGDIVED